MVAAAMDLTCQPAHATLVGLQLCLDEMSDMDIAFVGFHCLGFGLASASFPSDKKSVKTHYRMSSQALECLSYHKQ